MPSLTVIDRTTPENTFEEDDKGVFTLLKMVADIYGDDVVNDNWAALVNYESVRLELDSGQKIVILLHRD